MRFGCVFRSLDGAKRNPGLFPRISLRSMRATFALWLALTVAAVAQEKPDEPAATDEEKAAPAQEQPAPAPTEATESICLLIESAAAANGLPVEFFARVIWRESHYNPNAVGPPTRSGEGAPGL